jgi:hypothetical protein
MLVLTRIFLLKSNNVPLLRALSLYQILRHKNKKLNVVLHTHSSINYVYVYIYIYVHTYSPTERQTDNYTGR